MTTTLPDRPSRSGAEPGLTLLREAGPDLGVLGRLSSLADKTRARILLILEGRELAVGELCEVVQLPQSTVSRHLGILSGEGWLEVRSEGTSRHYGWSRSLPRGAAALWESVRTELEDAGFARRDRKRLDAVLRARTERSRTFFSSTAAGWDELRRELFGARVDLQLLPGLLNGDEVVGDLGCGTGHLSALIAPFASRVYAIDRSPEMLGVAQERLGHLENVEVRGGDLGALPLPDLCLDVAVLSLVLQYVADLEAALSDVHRVLRPGGRIVVLDMLSHDHAGIRDEMGQLRSGFEAEELGELLRSVGFEGPRLVRLPPDPEAAGPQLFVTRAMRSRA